VAPDAKQAEALRQIQEAFQTAQARLHELRTAVESHSSLSRVKAESDLLHHLKERALRELGEAVWRQVQKGKLELPESLGPALRAVEEAERKISTQAQEIGDLLMEGEAAAQQLKKK
jgi:hypothetical protein